MTLITTNADLQKFCNTLKNVPFITVDTEFMRERTYYAKLCLIQISGPDKNAAAIDTLSNDEELDLSPVWELMNDKKILKIFHAARQDLEIIYQLSGKIPAPLYDTQIAAMVCGFGEQAGYETLVTEICKIQIDKSSQFTDWAHRPLTDKQLNYALADVIHLIDIYEHLDGQLEKKNRHHWVIEETEALDNPELYDIDPYETWRRLKLRSAKPKDLAVLREVAAWREQKAQEKNVPRARVLKDETVVDLAFQKPKNAKDLARIRGISNDMANGKFGQQILPVIEKGKNSPEETWPELPIKKPLPAKLAPALEMLKMLLKIQASENHVAAKLIASAADLDTFVRSPEDKTHPLNHGWRYDIFGQHAEELMNGKLALTLKNSKIKKMKL